MHKAERDKLSILWQKAGFPSFPIAEDGFPVPGQVVRYYRERMTYQDKDGKTRHWTQADVGKVLRLSELSIRQMEKQNKGLDSMERRALAAILKIPPLLLGLAPFDELQKVLQGETTTLDTLHIMTSKKSGGDEEISLYHDALHMFKSTYEQGTLHIQTLRPWIARISENMDQVSEEIKQELSTLLARYHIVAANAYSHDTLDWHQATSHLTTARQLAKTTNNNELLAVVSYHTGEMYLNQGNALLARDELDTALSLSKTAGIPVCGSILTYTALTHALTVTDMADAVYVQKLLHEAEQYISNDTGLMSFDTIQYLEDKADTLIILKRYDKALECLDTIEEYSIVRKRYRGYQDILRAECYIKQRKPEYDVATTMLSQVLEENATVQYYVNYVARLYKLLAASSYGNAPDVAELGRRLRALGKG